MYETIDTVLEAEINGTERDVQDAFHLDTGNPDGHVRPPRLARAGKEETVAKENGEETPHTCCMYRNTPPDRDLVSVVYYS